MRPPLDAGIAVFTSAAALLRRYSSSFARVWLHGRSAEQCRIFSQGTENRRLQRGGVTQLGVTPRFCRPSSCADDACRFNCCELFGAGFPTDALRSAGFCAVDVKHSGCSARAMKVSISFSAVKLLKSMQDAGYSAQELRAAGFGAVKMMVRVGEGRRGLYDVQHLLAAGYSEDELREAGFEVQQLKQ